VGRKAVGVFESLLSAFNLRCGIVFRFFIIFLATAGKFSKGLVCSHMKNGHP